MRRRTMRFINSHRSTSLLCLFVLAGAAEIRVWGAWPHRQQSNIQKLAGCIDKVETQIEQYGSVVPKQPDIWGQARLSKYRQMVETQLLNQQGAFQETINATISRSDQASFVNSMALQAAISGPQSIITRRGGSTVVNNTPAATTPASSTTSTTTSTSTTPATSPTPIAIPNAPDNSAAISSVAFTTTNANNQKLLPFTNGSGVAIEPVLMLDQLTTYLNHLNQLRRTNEGDDTADAPGYALHLVRIPVSLNPGKKTRQGYGAEITFTAEPVINDNLLPKVFKSLITNDVLDMTTAVMQDLVANPMPSGTPQVVDRNPLMGDRELLMVDRNSIDIRRNDGVIADPGQGDDNADLAQEFSLTLPSPKNADSPPKKPDPAPKKSDRGADVMRGLFEAPAGPGGVASSVVNISDVFSDTMLAALGAIVDANKKTPGFKAELILDLQKLAERHTAKAYSLLSAPDNQDLWETYATADLMKFIRNNDQQSVGQLRDQFVVSLGEKSNKTLTESNAVTAFAWAIIYNATTLNQRLIDDIAVVLDSNGTACQVAGGWYPYHYPHPPQDACAVFADYVRARWPVHVFAIDPSTTDQNVADTYSQRRDMQLSLSLAFTSGQISAQNFTRYARRLELDMETVALNRTQVGFSHGSDTFGWRFYPRVQSPPTEGNATVLFRDLLCGGPSRDAALKKMMLEPGQRECVALVIMPSFVPYVRIDSRTNWFKLSNPKAKEFDLKDSVGIGCDIKCLRDCAYCCQNDASCRGEDMSLLMRSVDQLEHRLPLQTCQAQVPYELTLPGRSLFSHGVSDLVPRLRGYYGEPGANGKAFNVVLLGEHFSALDTKVIAGNQLLLATSDPTTNQVTQLSRQVMVIQVPAGAFADGNTIDVHVATPYGISNHLAISIPATKPAPTTAQAATCTYKLIPTTAAAIPGVPAAVAPAVNYACISYTPAISVPYSSTTTAGLQTLDITYKINDITIVSTARVIAGTSNWSVNVLDVGQQLLNQLNSTHRIDPSSPPEQSTYTLTPISVSDNGAQVKVDGQLVISFKPIPTSSPPATPPVPAI